MTLTQALNMAGIYHTDGELERDLKFDAWLGKRRYEIVEQAGSEPHDPNVDIVIIKHSTHD